MTKKDLYYKGPWHAFYSFTSIKNKKQNLYTEEELKEKNYREIYTNFYKKKDSNEIVEITSVFSTEDYPDYNDCEYYFKDKVYLGIVEKWIRIGEYKIFK